MFEKTLRRVPSSLQAGITAFVTVRASSPSAVRFDCTLFSQDELKPLLQITGATIEKTAGATKPSDCQLASIVQLQHEWIEEPVADSTSVTLQSNYPRRILVLGIAEDVDATEAALAGLSVVATHAVAVDTCVIPSWQEDAAGLLERLTSIPADYDCVVMTALDLSREVCPAGCNPLLPWWIIFQAWCGRVERLVFLTRSRDIMDNSSVLGRSKADCLCNALSGALMSAQAEYPKMNMLSVEVDSSQTQGLESALRQAMVGEMGALNGDLEVQYHHGQRLVKRYTMVNEAAAAVGGTESTVCGALHTPGAVVVTGGLGALGLKTARTLVGSLGVRKLVLVSRSGKVSYEGQGLEEDLAWLQSAESGADVHIVRCDVSDESSVVSMLEEVRSTMGGISGIVHCAGLSGEFPIMYGAAVSKSSAIWSAKAWSAWLLHHYTAQDKLSIFTVFSSVAAAVGFSSLSVYSGANRFLDSLITHRRSVRLAGLSFQWPAISDVGMAVAFVGDNSEGKQQRQDASAWSITSAALQEVLCQHLPNSGAEYKPAVVTIMPSAVLQYMKSRPALQYAPAIAALRDRVRLESSASAQLAMATTASASRVASERRGLRGPVAARFTAQQVADITQAAVVSLLGDKAVDAGAQLMDIGMDSLEAAELPVILSREFGVKLSTTLIFNYPTIQSIVAYIQQLLGLEQSSNNSETLYACPSSSASYAPEQIAVTGMACRYPGDINNLTDMWEALSSGRDLTSEVPINRWDADAVSCMASPMDGGASLKAIGFGGFLSDCQLESFRASTFGIADAEASRMDPSQRLLLDVSYDALVDAGYEKEQLRGKRVGVFVGASGTFGEGRGL